MHTTAHRFASTRARRIAPRTVMTLIGPLANLGTGIRIGLFVESRKVPSIWNALAGTPLMHTALFTSSKLDGRILAVVRERADAVSERLLSELLMERYDLEVSKSDISFALKQLEADGRISRTKGNGSPIIAKPAKVVVVPALPGKEADLMASLGTYLAAGFKAKAGVGETDVYLSKDTSYTGPKKGIWERPDYVVVHAPWLPILGRRQLDVHSFELKTEDGCTMPSVYEAKHQRKATHYGHLVWNLPKDSAREALLKTIQDACLSEGIGLIRMSHGKGGHKFEHLQEAVYQPRQDRVIESFLSERLGSTEAKNLSDSLQAKLS